MKEEAFVPSSAQLEARRYFPRGLEQPPESYRFSMEALLLAGFVDPLPGARLLDLGTGCGVVALAVLCRHEHVEAHGIDIQPELTAAARRNAERLGFAHRFSVRCADLASPALFARRPEDIPLAGPDFGKDAAPAAAYDLVLANPPFRSRRRGRLPRSLSRRTALFAGENTLDAFCGAAATALAPEGALAMIYPAPRRAELFAALDRARLRPARILPVSPRARAPFSLLLTLARHVRPGSSLPHPPEAPPLVLHQEKSEGGRFTPAALAYCPFLACEPAPEYGCRDRD
jgi:tRNA1(Val) A37 N6-methylase TrmN6